MNEILRDNISDSYDFKKLRTQGGIYVDKTAYLYRLVSWQLRSRFIVTRPRRFGKSLMISTLQHILEGDKELFKGLYIAEKTDYDWQPVKVLHLDMSDIEFRSIDGFLKDFEGYIAGVLEDVGYTDYNYRYSPARNFGNALKALASETEPIAVLIDEYDAPVGCALDNSELAEAVRAELYGFYKKLKVHEKRISFLMLTGISRFSKLSVFSGLNNLTDLNSDDSFAMMFGYTKVELDTYFGEHMKAHAEVMGVSEEQYRKELKHWFNGYCFGKQAETVYNPYSIANTLSLKSTEFGSDWSQSGRSTMLVNFLKQQVDGLDFDINGEVRASQNDLLNTFDLSALSPLSMLYQCGYLTIDRYIQDEKTFVLRLPDEEIRQDINSLLFALCIHKTEGSRRNLRNYFYADDMPKFLETLQAHYQSLVYGPNEKPQEFNYQRALEFFFLAEGIRMSVETPDCDGKRSDMIVQRKNHVYVFEFKVDEGANVALKQILDRDYMGPYRLPGNTITLIGLSFKRDSHKLQAFAIERLDA